MRPDLIAKISNYFSSQPIEKAWLFGSYARSEQKKQSDIDILVRFSPDSRMTLLEYSRIVNDLQELTGKKVDLVEDGQLKHFVVDGANRDRVLIYERKDS